MNFERKTTGIGTGAIVAAVIVVILIAGAAYFIFVPSSTSTSTSVTTSSTTTTPTSSTVATSSSAVTSTNGSSTGTTGPTVDIIIPAGIGTNTSANFEPSSVTVAAGTTIVFMNKDTSIHNIDFKKTPSGVTIPTSPNSNTWTNSQYSVTLTVAGFYNFVCDYHAWMNGTITVTASSSTSTSGASSSTTSGTSMSTSVASTAMTSNSSTSVASTTSSAVSTNSSTSVAGPTMYIYLPKGIGANPALNFSPPTTTVAPGTTIIFVNNDTSSIHNIDFKSTPSGATIPTSPNTNTWKNNEYSVTLTVAGTYNYVCDYHSWMNGTITVS